MYMAKLTFLRYDNFAENQTPLQRNGMAAIPKTQKIAVNYITWFHKGLSTTNDLSILDYLGHSF